MTLIHPDSAPPPQEAVATGAGERCPTALRTVTLSAAYGTGGRLLGRELAAQLGVPFVDHAVTARVAESLGISPEAALQRDQRVARGIARVGRVWGSLALMDPVSLPGEPIALTGFHDEQLCRRETEEVIRSAAEGGGAVIYGRAAAVVLANREDCLHVRLTGPVDRRVERAMQLHSLTASQAARQLRHIDRERAAYWRAHYRLDPDNPRLYHLVLDATVLSAQACTAAILAAFAAGRP